MIRFGFYTPDVVLSSDLPDITIFSDHDYVDVRLSAYGNILLAGRYYTHNGTAKVSDISSLVEQFLTGNTDEPLCEFRIEAFFGEEEAELTEQSFTVLYCDKTIGLYDPTDWLRQNFLTLSPVRRLAPDSFIHVAWYTTENESVAVRLFVNFLNDKGVLDKYTYVCSGNGMIAHMNGVLTQYVYLADVRQRVMEAREIPSATLVSVTVRCEERSATFFIDPALADIVPFYYLNCFGVVEHIAMPRITTEKVKADRSVATIGKSSRFYDVTNSKEYEVESGPLTSDECLQVEQMFTSPAVRIPYGIYSALYDNDFDALATILITDFTSELSDTDEKPNSVKFTWRFAENRPKVNIPTSPGIFNDKFQPPFS